METQNSTIIGIMLITTVLTCGLAIPIWIFVGIVYVIIEIFKPNKPIEKPIEKSRDKPKLIFPSNDFSDDWEFKIYELE